MRPQRVSVDKGYRSRSIRAFLRRRGIRYTIPRRSRERHRGPFDRELHRARNRVVQAPAIVNAVRRRPEAG